MPTGDEIPPGTATPTVPLPDSVSFLALHPDGSPYKVDPCSGPINISYNPAGEPYGAVGDLAAAAEVISMGMSHSIHVTSTGASTAVGVTVTVGWVSDADELVDPVPLALGQGGPTYDTDFLVAGYVKLVAHPESPVTFGTDPGSYGPVMLHELMHALGVDHSTDTRDVMYPTLSDTTEMRLGPGDIAALNAVGGTCSI